MGLVDELEKGKMDSYADKMVQSVKVKFNFLVIIFIHNLIIYLGW